MAKSLPFASNTSTISSSRGRAGSQAFSGVAASSGWCHAGAADPRFVIHADVEFQFCAPWRREPEREHARPWQQTRLGTSELPVNMVIWLGASSSVVVGLRAASAMLTIQTLMTCHSAVATAALCWFGGATGWRETVWLSHFEKEIHLHSAILPARRQSGKKMNNGWQSITSSGKLVPMFLLN